VQIQLFEIEHRFIFYQKNPFPRFKKFFTPNFVSTYFFCSENVINGKIKCVIFLTKHFQIKWYTSLISFKRDNSVVRKCKMFFAWKKTNFIIQTCCKMGNVSVMSINQIWMEIIKHVKCLSVEILNNLVHKTNHQISSQ